MEDSNVNIKKEQKCYWEIDIIAPSGDMLILSKPLNKQTRGDIVKIPNRLIEFDVWIF
jgi:hypothetical protein